MNETFYVITVKGPDDEVILVTDRKGEVHSYESPEQVDRSFNYRRHHEMGYQGSMSACIHNIMFQPKWHRTTKEELEKLVDIPFGVVHVSNVSGRFDGIVLNGKGKKFRETGTSVSLM